MSKFTPGDWHVSELDATGEKSEHYIFIEPGVAVIERTAGGSQCDMADAHLLASSKLLLEALESCLDALWEDSREVRMDGTMMFGHGYDWDGWEHYRWELHTRQGSFAIWPAHGTYSAYGGLDGSYWNQCFANAAEAKAAIVKYVARIDPEHPASKAFFAIAKARGES